LNFPATLVAGSANAGVTIANPALQDKNFITRLKLAAEYIKLSKHKVKIL
jgi:hypothetical protein